MLLSMCIEPIIDPLLPSKQARFRHRKSTVAQVTLLNQEIEDSFLTEKKAAAVFVTAHSSLRYCMAPWPHLQATSSSFS